MQRWQKIVSAFLVVALYAVGIRFAIGTPAASAASAPNIIGYQGRVLNANGVPFSDPSITMIFRLYDASSGGTCLWSNSSATCASATGMSVSLIDGLFAVELGDTADGFAAISDSLFADNATVYLQVTIGGETLSPRTQLLASPYALNADTLDGIDSADVITTSCADCLDFTYLDDTMTLDADTSVSLGANDYTFSLGDTGGLFIDDGGTPFILAVGENNLMGLGMPSFFVMPDGTYNISGAPFGVYSTTYNNTNPEGSLALFAGPAMTTGDVVNIDLTTSDVLSTSAHNLRVGRTLRDSASSSSGALVYITNTGDNLVDSGSMMQIDAGNINQTGDVIQIQSLSTGSLINATTTAENPTTAAVFIAATSTTFDEAALDITYNGTATAINLDAGLGTSSSYLVDLSGDTANYFLNVQNSNGLPGNNMQGIRVQACASTNPTSSCDFIAFFDGDGTKIGAIEGNGAGGVTNASTGSDYAELFPGAYAAYGAGDVLALANDGSVRLATADDDVLGTVSIAPNTLGNWRDGWYESGAWVPVALLGQVPVRVSAEAGAIMPGDYLRVGDVPGIAVRANGSGHIIGQALESLSAGTGTIQVFVRPGWHEATGVSVFSSVADVSADDAETLAPEASVINLGAAHITNVAMIAGLNGAWEITEGGDVRIRGRFTQIARGHNGNDVATYGVTSRNTVVQLVGTAHVEQGLTIVDLADIDPQFVQIMQNDASYKVFLTPDEGVGAAEVADKTATTFAIKLPSGATGDVDWLVVAAHKDYPWAAVSVPEDVIESDSAVEDVPLDDSTDGQSLVDDADLQADTDSSPADSVVDLGGEGSDVSAADDDQTASGDTISPL